jgi:hypothetical protein
MYHVYIPRCADSSLYVGSAQNADARLTAHQQGRGAAYTFKHRPVNNLVSGFCIDLLGQIGVGSRSFDHYPAILIVRARSRPEDRDNVGQPTSTIMQYESLTLICLP